MSLRALAFPFVVFASLTSLTLSPGCADDPSGTTGCPSCLPQAESVVTRLETVWNNGNINELDSLLDDDFVFVFAPGDVRGLTPPEWDRSRELAATAGVFDPNHTPAARSVRMDVKIADDTKWKTLHPADRPGETWYAATVFYEFTIEVEPDNTYIAVPGAKAEFVVRPVGEGTHTVWRLVRWTDVPASAPAIRAFAPASSSALSTEAVTWGAIKAIFAPTDLTDRVSVLGNLEQSYNDRSIARFEGILDPNFTFFFAPGDVSGTIPEQWGRTDELVVTNRLFDPNLNDPNFPRCRSTRMDLKFESGVQWVDFIPAAFPDETWYTTTIFYEFTFEMDPDNTYIAVPGAKAQFTVRNAGTEQSPHWQLVEFRDLAVNSLAAGASNEARTWGAIKSLYR